MIKKREEFRPFAPSVMAERAAEIFDLPSNQLDFPFMVFVVKVRREFAPLLGAVTHVDRTARIQTVSRASNPVFWQLLQAFDKLTGIPVLLNTSFNNNAEPIVDTVDDAVACFLTTQIAHLVVGNFIVSKKPAHVRRCAILELFPILQCHRRLSRRIHRGEKGHEWVLEICSTQSRFFGPTAARITREMFAVMSNADGQTSVNELIRMAGLDSECHMRLADEMFDLWSRRWVKCLPADSP